MAKANKSAEVADMSVAEKLKALYDLQLVDTAIDKIRILRGELPLEVQDLEDEIEGLQTRVSKYDADIEGLEKSISGKKQEIANAQELIKKYEAKRAQLKAEGDFVGLSRLPRNSNPIRLHNRCKLTGRPRGYMRQFGISRITFREMASQGLIPGVKKASW